MDIETALRWADQRTIGTLITIRSDGRPQSSDVAYWINNATITVSLTETRAKTRNIAADPRVVFHASNPATMSYVSFDGIAELSPTTTKPADSTSDALVAYHQAVAGARHPDWDEYRQAMIDERRLLATIHPTSATGQIHP